MVASFNAEIGIVLIVVSIVLEILGVIFLFDRSFFLLANVGLL